MKLLPPILASLAIVLLLNLISPFNSADGAAHDKVLPAVVGSLQIGF